MKCDHAQGYLFSSPLRAADVPALISRLENLPATTVRAFSNPADSAG